MGCVACFLDFENLYHSVRQNLNQHVHWQTLVETLRQMGTLSILRAYGNWSAYKDIQSQLMRAGFELVHTPEYRSDKSQDTRMIIDAVWMGSQPHIDTVVLATGDSDFIDVVHHLRNQGKRVVVLAVRATASPLLIQVASDFIAYESLVARPSTATAPSPPQSPQDLDEDTIQALTHKYLNALASRVRLTPYPQRPEALMRFFPLLKQYSGQRSFKAVIEAFQKDPENQQRFPQGLLQQLPHEVFHVYALVFPKDQDIPLWDRIYTLRPQLTSARAFLDWCDMGLTLWLAKKFEGLNDIHPAPLARMLYADHRPALVRRAEYVLELARKQWPHWPPRDLETGRESP